MMYGYSNPYVTNNGNANSNVGYQNMYNQPTQIIPQYQQMQLSLQGKVVNNFDEVTANDVPMNGSVAYFPKSDLSEIECRQWNANGTISRTVYKPILDDLSNNPNNVSSDDFSLKFDTLNERLDAIQSEISSIKDSMTTPTQNRSRKSTQKESE